MMRRLRRVRDISLCGCIGFFAVLAACGGNGLVATQTPAPSPTVAMTPTVMPTPPPTLAPTTPSATSSTGSATGQITQGGQNCGVVQMRGLGTVNGPSAGQSEDCIWRAYQQCASIGRAFMRVTQMGVDTITTRDFTVQGTAAGCTIQEMVEFRVIPRGPTTATYSCAGLTRDPDGTLRFQACGNDGTIVVAPPKP